MRRPRVRAPRRLLAAAGAAVAVSLVAGACDSSPVAASVNGAEIKQTALNQELRLETANRAYVDAVDHNAAASGSSFSVPGDAPGTYSSRFVAGILTQLIDAQAVHQYVAANGDEPGGEALAAARGVDEALFGSTWLSFPADFRDRQVTADAEHAQIEPAPSSSEVSQLEQAYQSVRKYFFSQVCVRTIAVTVDDGNGNVDQQASLAQATAVANQFDQSAGGSTLQRVSPPSGGTVACYDGAGLEAQGPALYNQVLALAPGHAAAPQPTDFGYQVVAVDSRRSLPLDPTVQKALALGITEAQGSPDPALQAILAKAHVTVDPQYGSWDPRQQGVITSSPLGANSSATGS